MTRMRSYVSLKKKLERKLLDVGKLRDQLRELLEEYSGVQEDLDEAHYCLETACDEIDTAVEALSRGV